MKTLSIDLERLRDAVSRAVGVLSKKVTMPALSYLLFKSDGQNLTIAANDLDIYFEIMLADVPSEPFEIGIQGSNLLTGLRLLSPGGVLLKIEPDHAQITHEGKKISLLTLDPAQMATRPQVPQAGGGDDLRGIVSGLSGNVLATLVNLTLPATSTLDTPQRMSSVLLRGEALQEGASVFTAVAMDNGLLNYAAVPISCKSGIHCNIPKHVAQRLTSALAEEESIAIGRTRDKAFFCFTSGFMAVSQPSQEPPPYERILRREPFSVQVQVSKTVLTKTLEGMVQFADSHSDGAWIWLKGADDGKVWVETQSGKQQLRLPLGEFRWDKQIPLAASSLISAIKRCQSDQLTFSWDYREARNSSGKKTLGGPIIVTSQETVGDALVDFVSMHGGLQFTEE